MLPPPVPSDTTQTGSSGSSGSKKRKRGQATNRQLTRTSSRSSNSTFSGSTREKVVELDHGGTCWHCRASPTDICHVIGKKDRDFDRLLQQGLITFENLGHVDNAIPLCPLCHRNFDDMLNPGFIFPPADLEYFIQYEKADQDRRREIGRRTGTMPTRVSPTAESYRNHQIETGAIPSDACGGTYMRFTLRDYFPKLGQPPFVPGAGSFPDPEPWHGAPMAALRRAFLVLGSPFLQGIPKETKHMLRTLLDLYSDDISNNDAVERDDHNSADESSEDEERRNDSTIQADLRSGHCPSRGQIHSASAQQGPDASQAPPTPLASGPLSHPREQSSDTNTLEIKKTGGGTQV
ncbi:hypothetical protein ACLOAV_010432 [Pseudogymnoascus australis]